MKKLIIGLSFCMIAFILSSCGNQNKSSENQSNNEATVQSSDTASTQTVQADQNQNSPQKPTSRSAEINGQQIVDNIAAKLNDKLNLSEEQFKNLTGVLSKKYSETYGDLNAKYDIETGKKIGRDLRLKSSAEISSILNPEQKEHFEKFMNK